MKNYYYSKDALKKRSADIFSQTLSSSIIRYYFSIPMFLILKLIPLKFTSIPAIK